MRIPITRHDADGTITDGTARARGVGPGRLEIDDWRDLDGEPLDLPAGSEFNVPFPASAIIDPP